MLSSNPLTRPPFSATIFQAGLWLGLAFLEKRGGFWMRFSVISLPVAGAIEETPIATMRVLAFQEAADTSLKGLLVSAPLPSRWSPKSSFSPPLSLFHCMLSGSDGFSALCPVKRTTLASPPSAFDPLFHSVELLGPLLPGYSLARGRGRRLRALLQPSGGARR